MFWQITGYFWLIELAVNGSSILSINNTNYLVCPLLSVVKQHQDYHLVGGHLYYVFTCCYLGCAVSARQIIFDSVLLRPIKDSI